MMLDVHHGWWLEILLSESLEVIDMGIESSCQRCQVSLCLVNMLVVDV